VTEDGRNGEPTAAFRPTPSPPPTTEPAVEARHAASDLVNQRIAAVGAKNRGSWLGTVTDPSTGFGADQAGLFDRMTALPIGKLAQRNVDVERPSGAATTGEPESWVARIRQTYAFTGYDVGQRDYTVSYVLKRTADGWRFTGVADGQNDRQPFDLDTAHRLAAAAALAVGRKDVVVGIVG